MSVQVLEKLSQITSPPAELPTIREVDAQRAASDYVLNAIDPTFVVSQRGSYHQSTVTWLFLIRCQQRSLHAIEVDAQTGTVIPLTARQICLVRERAAIAAARQKQTLPLDHQGYIFAEYARQCANQYLDNILPIFYRAMNPIWQPSDPPSWEVSILFQHQTIGSLAVGTLEIDAHSGSVTALSDEQITQIREQTRAIIGTKASTPNGR